MRTPLLSRSLLFLAFAFSAFVPMGRAAVSTIYYPSGPVGTIAPPSGFVGFEVSVERAGHSFAVYFNGALVTPRQHARARIDNDFRSGWHGRGAIPADRRAPPLRQLPTGSYGTRRRIRKRRFSREQ